MTMENKLNITNQVDLAKAEEKIGKQKAKQLFDSGDIDKVEVQQFQIQKVARYTKPRV